MRTAAEDPGQVGWVTENAQQLRIGGLGIAALLLIACAGSIHSLLNHGARFGSGVPGTSHRRL